MEVKANATPGTQLNCASRTFFLNCFRALQKLTHFLVSQPSTKKFRFVYLLRPFKRHQYRSCASCSRSSSMELSFLSKGGWLSSKPIHLLQTHVAISFFGNRTCYDQTHQGQSHLAPHTGANFKLAQEMELLSQFVNTNITRTDLFHISYLFQRVITIPFMDSLIKILWLGAI